MTCANTQFANVYHSELIKRHDERKERQHEARIACENNDADTLLGLEHLISCGDENTRKLFAIAADSLNTLFIKRDPTDHEYKSFAIAYMRAIQSAHESDAGLIMTKGGIYELV